MFRQSRTTLQIFFKVLAKQFRKSWGFLTNRQDLIGSKGALLDSIVSAQLYELMELPMLNKVALPCLTLPLPYLTFTLPLPYFIL